MKQNEVQCIEKGWYKSSHLSFEDDGPNIPGGKTRRFNVFNLNHSRLGDVKWYGAWRQYVFFPLDGTLYNKDCLRQIANFCELVTQEQKAKLPLVKMNKERKERRRQKRIQELAERKLLTNKENCDRLEDNREEINGV